MLEDFLSEQDADIRKTLVRALVTLENHGVYEHLRTHELVTLTNALVGMTDKELIYQRINAYQARINFIDELTLSLQTGDYNAH